MSTNVAVELYPRYTESLYLSVHTSSLAQHSDASDAITFNCRMKHERISSVITVLLKGPDQHCQIVN